MKPPVCFSAAIAAVLLSGCEIVPPPPDDYPPVRPDPGGPVAVAPAGSAYRAGRQQGSTDRESGRSFNPQRHIHDVPGAFRDNYREGYRDGYSDSGGQDSQDGADRAYQHGYRRGRDDSQSGRMANWQRHAGSYPERYSGSFRRGYAAGYESGVRGRDRNPPAVSGPRESYLRGYDAGRSDFRLGRRSAYQMHSGFTRQTEAAFRDGYHDGYSRRPARF